MTAQASGKVGSVDNHIEPQPIEGPQSAESLEGSHNAEDDELEERRGVVAEGMHRFDVGVEERKQPPWEKVSERVCCVLGGQCNQ